MTRLLMIAMTAVLSGCGAAFAQVGGMGITPGPSPLGMTSPLGMGPGSVVPPTGLRLGTTEVPTLGVSPMTSGTSPLPPTMISLTTCGGIGGSIPQASFGAASSSVGTTSGMGTSSAGTSSSTLLFDGASTAGTASGTALTDKRTPADIQALLAHVTASDTCVIVDSGERPPAIGARFACVHSCDGRTPTIDKLNLSRCDVMFFDLNGGEAAAIKGATATIKRFAPVIITALPAEATSDIIDALQALDYRLVDKVGGDYVYMKGEPI
jgi:hypothetical protein